MEVNVASIAKYIISLATRGSQNFIRSRGEHGGGKPFFSLFPQNVSYLNNYSLIDRQNPVYVRRREREKGKFR